MALNTVFPDFCITEIKNTQKQSNFYYGEHYTKERIEIELTLLMENDIDIERLANFWYSDISYGTLDFEINLPIFARSEYRIGRLTTDLSEQLSGTTDNGARLITLGMEILNDVGSEFILEDFRAEIRGNDALFTIEVDSPVSIDWGDGKVIYYTQSPITGRPFGIVTITSKTPLSTLKFIGDDITQIDIIKANSLINAYEICKDNISLVSFSCIANSLFQNVVGFFDGCTNLSSIEWVGVGSVLSPTCTDVTRMYKGVQGMSRIAPFDTSTVITFTSFLENTGIEVYDWNTENGEIFDRFLYNAANLICIESIDTRNQTSTTDMFVGTTLLNNPDATDQADILAGALWENTEPCVGSSGLYTSAGKAVYTDTNQRVYTK